jgi:hypothetical protein
MIQILFKEKQMKTDLLKMRQPFGDVKNERPNGGEGRPAFLLSKPLGAETVRQCHGQDQFESSADKNPNAAAMGCAHGSDPFYWSGVPRRGL